MQFFGKEFADAVLCVSFLHHFSTFERRLKILENLNFILKSPLNSAQILIYVWAKEQPNAVFPSQDVLVPWNLHELSKNGLFLNNFK